MYFTLWHGNAISGVRKKPNHTLAVSDKFTENFCTEFTVLVVSEVSG